MSDFDNPIMLDMETLGTRPRSAILSIGACKFDPSTNSITDEFYVTINTSSCTAMGLEVDMETVNWWQKQSEEAKKVLEETKFGGLTLRDALKQFQGFCGQYNQVWGNGSDFDNAMLQEIYKLCGMEAPWKFWNNRCYRTMKNAFPLSFKREGVHHNALDDAKYQAKHLMAILDKIRGIRPPDDYAGFPGNKT